MVSLLWHKIIYKTTQQGIMPGDAKEILTCLCPLCNLNEDDYDE